MNVRDDDLKESVLHGHALAEGSIDEELQRLEKDEYQTRPDI